MYPRLTYTRTAAGLQTPAEKPATQQRLSDVAGDRFAVVPGAVSGDPLIGAGKRSSAPVRRKPFPSFDSILGSGLRRTDGKAPD